MSQKPLYDDHRPETFPAYRIAAKVGVEMGGKLTVVGLKATGLDVYFGDGQNQFYDLEGRLIRVATPEIQWRRGLSNRTIELRKRPRREGGGFERRVLAGSDADRIIEGACGRMRDVHTALRSGQRSVESETADQQSLDDLERIVGQSAGFDATAAQDDLAQFRAIYDDVPILPPDQYTSLVLMATEGCRYNQCTFCGFYRGARYREKTLDEFQMHMDQAVQYHGRGLALRRGIFLGQANALMGSQMWREAILKSVNERFEFLPIDKRIPVSSWWKGSQHRFTGITSFLDAFMGVRISADEFSEMHRLNLRQIFIGMETGDPDLLKWLRKPADPQKMLETTVAAKEGGVQVGVIVLIGAGGEPFFDRHVQQTVELVREMRLERGDFIYLSPLIDAPETEYAQLAAAENVQPLSPVRMSEQEQLIRTGINASPTRNGPYVAHYEVANFVY